jgi:DNA-binding NarL/FixJ family response regulator
VETEASPEGGERGPARAASTQGKLTSRPPLPEATRKRIAELHGQGMSIKRIAKELGVAYGTAWNYVKGMKGTATMP